MVWCRALRFRLAASVSLIAVGPALAAEPRLTANDIVGVTGVRAGLCIHLGSGDGELTADLGRAGNLLVHGLAADASTLEKARAHIRQQGVYGKVSVERATFERLPYADSLANLVVADDLPALLARGQDLAEVMRVLAPNGAAWVGAPRGLTADGLRETLEAAGIRTFQVHERSGVWARITRPEPAGVDEWTHHNYGPGGNRVSGDTVVGPPERLRWIAGVEWPMPDYAAKGMVVSGHRVFYVINESPHRKVNCLYLSARDAYSGVLLWKRHLRAFNALTMLASGERLYLGIDGRMAALDAATGEVARAYPEAPSPAWAVLYRGNLLAAVGPRCELLCLDAETGEVRWRNGTRSFEPAGGLPNVALDEDAIFFAQRRTGTLGRLDLATGAEKWHRDITPDLGGDAGALLCSYQKGTIVLGGSKGIHAFASDDGRHLWSCRYELLGTPTRRKAKSYCDGFFIDGLYWAHVGDALGEGDAKYKTRAYYWQGLDPMTGEPRKRFPLSRPPGASCYRDQATVRYFMGGYTDFVETKTGQYHPRAPGVHASCGIGPRVAYGLMYNCALYQPQYYLQGDMALTTAAALPTAPPETAPRLEKGPAAPPEDAAPDESDWPCYRHDPLRTNRSPAPVPPDLERLWSAKVGGRLSPATAAGGAVFVASVNEHAVVALDAATGEVRWRFTAGAPVKTPPTVHQGLALFGSNDGWVYCVRASDGALVWRFRAARSARRIVARERVESTWPVEGGGLVVDGLAYFAAGRNGGIDGGIDLYAVDPVTGTAAWQTRVERSRTMCLLASDGTSLSMWDYRSRFALKADGGRPPAPRVPESAYQRDMLYLTEIVGTAERTGEEAFVPVGMRAAIRAGDTVFLAGRPPSQEGGTVAIQWRKGQPGSSAANVPEKHPLEAPAQEAGHLWAFSTADGRMLGEVKLDAPAVFDGLAAARGRLYVACEDGAVHCFGRR